MKLAEAAVPDPAALGSLIERVRAALRVPPSFPILGLNHPALTPSRLVDLHEEGGRLSRIALGYGEAGGSAGRFVLVVAGPPGRALDDLAGLLAAEAQRLGEEVTQDPPMAPELTPAGGLGLQIPLEVDGMIVVDNLPVPAHLRRQGRLWAAHITVSPNRVVTVVARGVDPGMLQLSQVTDVRPYVAAWEEHQYKLVAAAALSAAERARPVAPVAGLDGHVAVVRAHLAQRLAAGSRPATPDRPWVVRADGDRPELVQLWQQAVQAQEHYAKQSRGEAEDAVACMVSQAVWLAERAPWFTDPARVDRAVEELARFTAFDSDVPSRRAQEWWGRVWSLTAGSPPSSPEQARDQARERGATESVWLTAWERWADGGGPGRRR